VTGWLLDRTHSFRVALGICTAVTLLGALSYATLAAPTAEKHLQLGGEAA
jgi:MFS transporter, ACS family, L-galactonate transporter